MYGKRNARIMIRLMIPRALRTIFFCALHTKLHYPYIALRSPYIAPAPSVHCAFCTFCALRTLRFCVLRPAYSKISTKVE